MQNRFQAVGQGYSELPRLHPDAPSVQPAVDVIDKAIAQARRANSPDIDALSKVRDQLLYARETGHPLPIQTTPTDILDRKQGIGRLITGWEKQGVPFPEHVRQQVYQALDSELDRAVPESQQLNERMHNLIPIGQRAAETSRSPDVMQRAFERVARPTGGLALPAVMAAGGARESGLPGALLGGGLGLWGLEAASSPAVKAAAARGLYSGIPPRILPALTFQMTRDEEAKNK
jgi:hypothetical protein